jgi:anhydro-N-acetylmuramic acid kinase
MKILKAIGLMSGTSLDGIDAAIIDTDGHSVSEVGANYSYQYEPAFKEEIRALFSGNGDVLKVEEKLTLLHADAVNNLLKKAGFAASNIDVIGFHGQTIKHAPEQGITQQIGDGKLLAAKTGIKVVNDFRTNDVKHGGQGAPLVPLYHAALVRNESLPVAIVNIGGVGNVTWIGGDNDLLAFDTGPGNALVDDWVLQHSGHAYDKNGEIAAKGKVNQEIVQRLLDNAYFAKIPPKSLDRNSFVNNIVDGLKLEDGAATLAAFTTKSIANSAQHFKVEPKKWYIAGGGRHNSYIMQGLQKEIGVPVLKIEELGHNGDMLEAEAFAFLAVRSLYNLPLSLPTTTGVREAITGGVLCEAYESGI